MISASDQKLIEDAERLLNMDLSTVSDLPEFQAVFAVIAADLKANVSALQAAIEAVQNDNAENSAVIEAMIQAQEAVLSHLAWVYEELRRRYIGLNPTEWDALSEDAQRKRQADFDVLFKWGTPHRFSRLRQGDLADALRKQRDMFASFNDADVAALTATFRDLVDAYLQASDARAAEALDDAPLRAAHIDARADTARLLRAARAQIDAALLFSGSALTVRDFLTPNPAA